MMENHIYHDKTKYIDIDSHFSSHHYKYGFDKLVYVESTKQVADIFTKGLGPSSFYLLMFNMNMECHHP